MSLPTWALVAVVLSAFLHTTQFLMDDAGMCDDDDGLPDTSGNALEVVQSYATFDTCGGGTGWFQLGLFTIGTLPLLLILAIFLFQLFNNAVTGTVVGALAVIAGLIALFS